MLQRLDAPLQAAVTSLQGLGDPERKARRVLRLINHLYGHPLANAAFQERWVQLMEEFGFKVVDAAKTVFSYERGSKRILVATVVDDSVVAYSNAELYNEYKEFLLRNLPITECPLDTICGMRITRNADSSISIDQQEYIEKKADAFHQNSTKGSWIMSPMSAQFKLDDVRP